MGEEKMGEHVALFTSLAPNDRVDIRIGNHVISVTHRQDVDGNSYLKLGGVNCNLSGEMPGEYYPEPLSAEWSK